MKIKLLALCAAALSVCGSSAAPYYSRYWEGTKEENGKYYWTSVESHNWSKWYLYGSYFHRNYFVNRNFRTTGSRTVSFKDSVLINQATIFGNERKDETDYKTSDLYMNGGPIVFVGDSSECGLNSTGACYIGGDEGDGSLRVVSGTYKATNWNIGQDSGKTGSMEVLGGMVIGTGGTDDSCVGVSGTGTLTIADGGVFQSGSEENVRPLQLAKNSGSVGTINLNEGGELRGSKINQGSGTGVVNFNGGTFKVIYSEKEGIFPDNGNLTVRLNEKGGVIDTQGYDSLIKKEITGIGSLTKKGSATLTFTEMPTFSGKIKVAYGAGDVILPTGATIEAGANTKKEDNGKNTVYSNTGISGFMIMVQ